MKKDVPISSDLIRGHIDTIILRVLSDEDHYGYEIMKMIFEQSGGKFELKEPSLYTSLKRLEKQGQITAYWGNESQGGRRKYYQITPLGLEMYEQSYQEWMIAKEVITQLLKREGKNDE